jgi:aspartate/methionine/tyrosine aminotransferase
MQINKSGARFSSIVGIGQEIKKMSLESGQEYLYLNRGINNVVKINLSEIIPMIDFNTDEMQFYPPTFGNPKLRKAINNEFFAGSTSDENIFITVGGMHALSLIFATLNVQKIFTYHYFWGSYNNILKIENKDLEFYTSFEELKNDTEKYRNQAVLICDPNNPTGEKHSDTDLFEILENLRKVDATVIWDGPYRRLFYENTDDLYQKLLTFENVIICESFSKSVGLSGQRVGFVHSVNQEFVEEFGIRLLYSVNGVNSFSQILIEKILTTPHGKRAATEYRQKTKTAISQNIEYLKKRNLLPEKIYGKNLPVGIFTIVNQSSDLLLKHRIGSVPMKFFTKTTDSEILNYSRICVSVPNQKFEEFFDQIL